MPMCNTYFPRFQAPSPTGPEDKLCNQFASPCLAEGKLFAPPWEARSYLVLDLEKPEEEPVPVRKFSFSKTWLAMALALKMGHQWTH